MAKTIEVDESLARCVREAETGEECVFTRNGRPVARLVSVLHKRVLTSDQEAARARARAIMEEGWDLGIEYPLDRHALHERR